MIFDSTPLDRIVGHSETGSKIGVRGGETLAANGSSGTAKRLLCSRTFSTCGASAQSLLPLPGTAAWTGVGIRVFVEQRTQEFALQFTHSYLLRGFSLASLLIVLL